MKNILNKIKKIGSFNFSKLRINISIQQIALAGLMLALITIFKVVDKFIPKSPVGSAWIELYMIFAVIMVLILPFVVSTMVLISAPLLWFAIGSTWQQNPFSFILDYSLPLLSVLIIYVAKFISEKKINIRIIKISYRQIAIFILIIISFIIKWFFHTISGVISYGTTFMASAWLNSLFTFATMGVALGVSIIFIPKISQLQKLVNNNAMRW